MATKQQKERDTLLAYWGLLLTPALLATMAKDPATGTRYIADHPILFASLFVLGYIFAEACKAGATPPRRR